MLYACHVFCCVNERDDKNPRGSCGKKGSLDLRNYMKKRVKSLGLDSCRVNTAGCLDRCEKGPVLVVYRQGVWYRVTTRAEIDEIIEEHLVNGNVVSHLIV